MNLDSVLAFEVSNLTKRFGEILAVNDISFQVNKGELFGFLGPNGAGKTTIGPKVDCITLILYTRGGETLASWSSQPNTPIL